MLFTPARLWARTLISERAEEKSPSLQWLGWVGVVANKAVDASLALLGVGIADRCLPAAEYREAPAKTLTEGGSGQGGIWEEEPEGVVVEGDGGWGEGVGRGLVFSSYFL